MTGDLGDDGVTKLGVAGALCREYAADERAFLGFFADSLNRALNEDVELVYQGGFLSKKTLKAVVIRMGEDQFTLEDPGRGPLKATYVHVVRGIALKTELIRVEDLLATVADLVELRVAQHDSARQALGKMLGLN